MLSGNSRKPDNYAALASAKASIPIHPPSHPVHTSTQSTIVRVPWSTIVRAPWSLCSVLPPVAAGAGAESRRVAARRVERRIQPAYHRCRYGQGATPGLVLAVLWGALLLLIGFILLGLKLGACEKKITYPIALFGQASLPIYTAHTFVLPALNWLGHLFVVEDVPRIILPLLLFAIYCAVVMDYYHREALRPKSG